MLFNLRQKEHAEKVTDDRVVVFTTDNDDPEKEIIMGEKLSVKVVNKVDFKDTLGRVNSIKGSYYRSAVTTIVH